MILGPFAARHGMVSHLIQAQEVKRASATRVPLAHSNLHFHGEARTRLIKTESNKPLIFQNCMARPSLHYRIRKGYQIKV